MTAPACVSRPGVMVVRNPWSGAVLAELPAAGAPQVEAALERARAGAVAAAGLSRAARGDILDRTAASLEADAEGAACLITQEAGKPIAQARKEVRRAVNTLRLSAAEARRLCGETLPFDSFAGAEGVTGFFEREPLGVILGVTPFNDPLNLVCHKAGPAIAGGNALILKPSELAPLSAMALASRLEAAGLPPGVFTVINGGPEAVRHLAGDPCVRMISFTGGTAAAEAIVRAGGVKRYAMDLGGVAPVLVMADADLDAAVASCVSGAFWAAGQNCVGVQRILVERPIAEAFTSAFAAAAGALRLGDPMDETVDVGPMINADHASRVETLIGEATGLGARLLTGGARRGALLAPAVLADTPAQARLSVEEAFGPVVSIVAADDLDEALALANSTEISLHAAIFTGSLDQALAATRRLQASSVMVNMSSDFRHDAMPFGGFKAGGLGREGVRFALEEMTQTKVTAFAPLTRR
ncbi:aldehyde dehydrogenase family protein [Phenylobacterium sp.]|uniref:aldehyde dehydrogenase family protein n=1 Tax=Phenylobacterium sp. TaxID=1871053 RepID=UPI0035B3D723